MNAKQRTITICFLVVNLLTASLVISGCGPGQLFEPTLTPTLTSTPIPTPTPPPTPTPVPTGQVVGRLLRVGGDSWLDKEEQASLMQTVALCNSPRGGDCVATSVDVYHKDTFLLFDVKPGTYYVYSLGSIYGDLPFLDANGDNLKITLDVDQGLNLGDCALVSTGESSVYTYQCHIKSTTP
jgi:hypothetical protein